MRKRKLQVVSLLKSQAPALLCRKLSKPEEIDISNVMKSYTHRQLKEIAQQMGIDTHVSKKSLAYSVSFESNVFFPQEIGNYIHKTLILFLKSFKVVKMTNKEYNNLSNKQARLLLLNFWNGGTVQDVEVYMKNILKSHNVMEAFEKRFCSAEIVESLTKEKTYLTKGLVKMMKLFTQWGVTNNPESKRQIASKLFKMNHTIEPLIDKYVLFIQSNCFQQQKHNKIVSTSNTICEKQNIPNSLKTWAAISKLNKKVIMCNVEVSGANMIEKFKQGDILANKYKIEKIVKVENKTQQSHVFWIGIGIEDDKIHYNNPNDNDNDNDNDNNQQHDSVFIQKFKPNQNPPPKQDPKFEPNIYIPKFEPNIQNPIHVPAHVRIPTNNPKVIEKDIKQKTRNWSNTLFAKRLTNVLKESLTTGLSITTPLLHTIISNLTMNMAKNIKINDKSPQKTADVQNDHKQRFKNEQMAQNRKRNRKPTFITVPEQPRKYSYQRIDRVKTTQRNTSEDNLATVGIWTQEYFNSKLTRDQEILGLEHKIQRVKDSMKRLDKMNTNDKRLKLKSLKQQLQNAKEIKTLEEELHHTIEILKSKEVENALNDTRMENLNNEQLELSKSKDILLEQQSKNYADYQTSSDELNKLVHNPIDIGKYDDNTLSIMLKNLTDQSNNMKTKHELTKLRLERLQSLITSVRRKKDIDKLENDLKSASNALELNELNIRNIKNKKQQLENINNKYKQLSNEILKHVDHSIEVDKYDDNTLNEMMKSLKRQETESLSREITNTKELQIMNLRIQKLKTLRSSQERKQIIERLSNQLEIAKQKTIRINQLRSRVKTLQQRVTDIFKAMKMKQNRKREFQTFDITIDELPPFRDVKNVTHSKILESSYADNKNYNQFGLDQKLKQQEDLAIKRQKTIYESSEYALESINMSVKFGSSLYEYFNNALNTLDNIKNYLQPTPIQHSFHSINIPDNINEIPLILFKGQHALGLATQSINNEYDNSIAMTSDIEIYTNSSNVLTETGQIELENKQTKKTIFITKLDTNNDDLAKHVSLPFENAKSLVDNGWIVLLEKFAKTLSSPLLSTQLLDSLERFKAVMSQVPVEKLNDNLILINATHILKALDDIRKSEPLTTSIDELIAQFKSQLSIMKNNQSDTSSFISIVKSVFFKNNQNTLQTIKSLIISNLFDTQMGVLSSVFNKHSQSYSSANISKTVYNFQHSIGLWKQFISNMDIDHNNISNVYIVPSSQELIQSIQTIRKFEYLTDKNIITTLENLESLLTSLDIHNRQYQITNSLGGFVVGIMINNPQSELDLILKKLTANNNSGYQELQYLKSVIHNHNFKNKWKVLNTIEAFELFLTNIDINSLPTTNSHFIFPNINLVIKHIIAHVPSVITDSKFTKIKQILSTIDTTFKMNQSYKPDDVWTILTNRHIESVIGDLQNLPTVTYYSFTLQELIGHLKVNAYEFDDIVEVLAIAIDSFRSEQTPGDKLNQDLSIFIKSLRIMNDLFHSKSTSLDVVPYILPNISKLMKIGDKIIRCLQNRDVFSLNLVDLLQKQILPRLLKLSSFEQKYKNNAMKTPLTSIDDQNYIEYMNSLKNSLTKFPFNSFDIKNITPEFELAKSALESVLNILNNYQEQSPIEYIDNPLLKHVNIVIDMKPVTDLLPHIDSMSNIGKFITHYKNGQEFETIPDTVITVESEEVQNGYDVITIKNTAVDNFTPFEIVDNTESDSLILDVKNGGSYYNTSSFPNSRVIDSLKPTNVDLHTLKTSDNLISIIMKSISDRIPVDVDSLSSILLNTSYLKDVFPVFGTSTKFDSLTIKDKIIYNLIDEFISDQFPTNLKQKFDSSKYFSTILSQLSNITPSLKDNNNNHAMEQLFLNLTNDIPLPVLARFSALQFLSDVLSVQYVEEINRYVVIWTNVNSSSQTTRIKPTSVGFSSTALDFLTSHESNIPASEAKGIYKSVVNGKQGQNLRVTFVGEIDKHGKLHVRPIYGSTLQVSNDKIFKFLKNMQEEKDIFYTNIAKHLHNSLKDIIIVYEKASKSSDVNSLSNITNTLLLDSTLSVAVSLEIPPSIVNKIILEPLGIDFHYYQTYIYSSPGSDVITNELMSSDFNISPLGQNSYTISEPVLNKTTHLKTFYDLIQDKPDILPEEINNAFKIWITQKYPEFVTDLQSIEKSNYVDADPFFKVVTNMYMLATIKNPENNNGSGLEYTKRLSVMLRNAKYNIIETKLSKRTSSVANSFGIFNLQNTISFANAFLSFFKEQNNNSSLFIVLQQLLLTQIVPNDTIPSNEHILQASIGAVITQTSLQKMNTFEPTDKNNQNDQYDLIYNVIDSILKHTSSIDMSITYNSNSINQMSSSNIINILNLAQVSLKKPQWEWTDATNTFFKQTQNNYINLQTNVPKLFSFVFDNFEYQLLIIKKNLSQNLLLTNDNVMSDIWKKQSTSDEEYVNLDYYLPISIAECVKLYKNDELSLLNNYQYTLDNHPANKNFGENRSNIVTNLINLYSFVPFVTKYIFDTYIDTTAIDHLRSAFPRLAEQWDNFQSKHPKQGALLKMGLKYGIRLFVMSQFQAILTPNQPQLIQTNKYDNVIFNNMKSSDQIELLTSMGYTYFPTIDSSVGIGSHFLNSNPIHSNLFDINYSNNQLVETYVSNLIDTNQFNFQHTNNLISNLVDNQFISSTDAQHIIGNVQFIENAIPFISNPYTNADIMNTFSLLDATRTISKTSPDILKDAMITIQVLNE
jgi:hypothetical protein